MMHRRQFLRAATALAAYSTLPLPRLARTDQLRLPRRPIPGTNETLPIIGLGNSQAFRDGDMARSRALIDYFHDQGGAYIDVSGSSRFVTGQIASELSIAGDLFFGTYIETGNDAQDRSEAREVLAAQNRKQLDLVLTRDLAGYSARQSSYQGLKTEGLARYLGVARHQERYHDPMMALMEAAAVDFVQVNYSILEPEAAERLLPMARDLGIAVLINRPFINGQYFSVVKGHELPAWAAEIGCDTWAKFSLKYILSHPAVTCVLTETANPKHAADNIGAGFGPMPDEATRSRMAETIRALV
jgi:diketogulonate reductase-like aldo/keto reductase